MYRNTGGESSATKGMHRSETLEQPASHLLTHDGESNKLGTKRGNAASNESLTPSVAQIRIFDTAQVPGELRRSHEPPTGTSGLAPQSSYSSVPPAHPLQSKAATSLHRSLDQK